MTDHTTLTGLLVASMLLLSSGLSGCLYQFVEHETTIAEWHQPELWEAFPEDEKVGEYEISVAGLEIMSKSASLKKDKIGEVLGVTENGDVHYRLRYWRQLSSDAIRDHMEDMFDVLSLPEPSLSSEYQFNHEGFKATGVWYQEKVWDQFPSEGSNTGFEIYRHDSLKVAFKADAWTSEWVRVNGTGVVEYKFEHREKFVYHGPYSHDNRSLTVWNQMESTFENLSLPPPELNRSHDFGDQFWFWPYEVID